MNKRMIMLMAAALALLSASGQVTFRGVGEHKVIEVTPDMNTGLNKIYVVYDTQGVSMSYPSTNGKRAEWYSFDYKGINIDEIPGVRWDGRSTTLSQVIPNKGYKIEETGGRPFYCWVVNYADYMMSLNDIFWDNDKPCSLLTLKVDGIAPAIPYASVNFRPMVLDRELELTYYTKVRDDSTDWQLKKVIDYYESLNSTIQINQPLCDTKFTLRGDRFLKEWGLEEVVESRDYVTHAVSCGATADQEDRGYDNEKGNKDGLGGSAPVHILFTGYYTDAVVYRVWEIATDPDFENIIMSFPYQDELDYTFNDAGAYYVRYRVANDDGSCEDLSEIGPITVSESELQCPNIFSPGSTEGVNDVWKVSYKSLIEFHCWIYNRWGNLVCEFTDPGSGWDGTYHGQLVDTGVYYYVVTATGSDGVKYKKRGDITILRYTRGAGAAGGDGGGGMGGGSEY